jgi:hypothetical protein
MRSVASRFSPPKSSVTRCFDITGLRVTGTLSRRESSPAISDMLASFALMVKVCGALRVILTLQGFSFA